MAEEDLDLSFFVRVLSFHVPFQLPRTESVSFSKSYSNYLSNPDIADAIQILESTREEVVNQGKLRDRDDGGMIAAIDQFYPYEFQLVKSVMKNTNGVMLTGKLEFEWFGGLASGKNTDRNKDQALMFDLCISLSAKALALANLATLTIPEYGAAIAMLKDAAGIMSFLAQENLPDRYKLVESNGSIQQGLSTFFLAKAQLIAVAKALTGAEPKYSTVAKLCIGAQNMMKRAVETMRRSNALYAKLPGDFLRLFTLYHYLSEALAHYCLARHAYAQTEVGKAVAYIQQANRLVQQRASITSKGLPELDGDLRRVRGDIQLLRAHVAGLEETYSRDNSSVYFMAIPNPGDLEIVSGVVMMQPTPFAPPDMPILPFESGDGLTSCELQHSDSELARELQEKLNAGEA
mmetsp:Transcript_2408/g.3399  ORF Transcript_2408/g.3399 Transcript_2408/m.3399 type:complete len:405 (+) Transcript_2408:84-1298(+)